MGRVALNRRLLHLSVDNFRTLTHVELPLEPLTVMVGPNAAGKSNVIHVFEFLRQIADQDIPETLQGLGGYEEVAYRGGGHVNSAMRVGLRGLWSQHATEAEPDSYDLSLRYRLPSHAPHGSRVLSRRERFVHPTAGVGSSTTELRSDSVFVDSPDPADVPTLGLRKNWDAASAGPLGQGDPAERLTRQRLRSALHHGAPVPPGSTAYNGLASLVGHLRGVRIFDVDVRAARRPTSIGNTPRLDDTGANLADFLKSLRADDDSWELFMEDVTTVLPHIEGLDLIDVGAHQVTLGLRERGLRGTTRLADASFGTIRLLCLLALFHDPNPPLMTCIEEIDHGIHPHALELLCQRLREASERAQFLVTTHSPVFVDHLEPEEFVVCERDSRGRSRIPAMTTEDVRKVIDASEGLPIGELWFSGTLGGNAW